MTSRLCGRVAPWKGGLLEHYDGISVSVNGGWLVPWSFDF